MLQKSQSKGQPREYWMFMEAYFFLARRSNRGTAWWRGPPSRRGIDMLRTALRQGPGEQRQRDLRLVQHEMVHQDVVLGVRGDSGPPRRITFTPDLLHWSMTASADSFWMDMADSST